MDTETRKTLETHYRILMKQASVIKALLDGDKPQTIAPAELKGADVAGTSFDAWARQQATLTRD